MSHNIIKDLFYSFFPDTKKYLTYGKGNSNILLSAPHGGNIKPVNIPPRTSGNRSGDSYTRRLIIRIIELMEEKPYYIYADIHRSRIDLNRNIKDGVDNNKEMERVWYSWNTILESYTNDIRSKFGSGLYIDIHSHNKSNSFELGYGLKVSDYLALRDGKRIKDHSTTFPIKRYNSEKRMLFGDGSFEQTIKQSGFKVLLPTDDESYLNGGRNIQKFSGNSMGAIQIECPIPILSKQLNYVAETLVKAIYTFEERFL